MQFLWIAFQNSPETCSFCRKLVMYFLFCFLRWNILIVPDLLRFMNDLKKKKLFRINKKKTQKQTSKITSLISKRLKEQGGLHLF